LRAKERVEALLHPQLDNVIFFSQHEQPSLPNQLAGGDLDGDRYEVVTEDCGFLGPEYTTSPPANYTESESCSSSKATSRACTNKPFDINGVARFIGDYIRNDCFDVLQEHLMCMADQKCMASQNCIAHQKGIPHQEEHGMRNPQVKELSPWLSEAVDYAKSGKEVNLESQVLNNPKFSIRKEKPDFVHALRRKAFYDQMDEEIDCGKTPSEYMDESYEPEPGYYESPHLLGRIYRKIIGKKFPEVGKCDNMGLEQAVINHNSLLQKRHPIDIVRQQHPPSNKLYQQLTGNMPQQVSIPHMSDQQVNPIMAKVSSLGYRLPHRTLTTTAPDTAYSPRATLDQPPLDYSARVTEFVLSEMRYYRKYLRARGIEEETEYEMFLHLSNDGFPDVLIQRLLTRTLIAMGFGMYEGNPAAASRSPSTEADEGLATTRYLHRQCLWRAW
jgi:hypothetical protein